MKIAFRFAIATFLGLLACCIVSAASAADTPATLPLAIQTFFKQHCYECHGSDAQESGLRFDGIMRYRTEDTHLWTKVHQKLTACLGRPRAKSLVNLTQALLGFGG